MIPAIPVPLRWLHRPVEWHHPADDALVVRAGARTDLFADPSGEDRHDSAPALVGQLAGDLMLSARVQVKLAAAFDAGALVLYHDEQTWAKLCLERSPQGQPMIVSVVTRGVSDDCNSFPVAGDTGDTGRTAGTAELRISRLGPAYAFHARTGGSGAWQMVRYFALPGEPAVGFLAQSPTGDGCTVRFDAISYAPKRLTDLRDGT